MAAERRRPATRPAWRLTAGLVPGEFVKPGPADRGHVVGWPRDVEQLPDRGEIVDGGHG